MSFKERTFFSVPVAILVSRDCHVYASKMIPWYARLYFWGVHGIFAEILFTGIWEFAVTGKYSLMGVSSIWSFLTYGLGTFLVAEPLHEIVISFKFNWLSRGIIYVAITYIWEFTVGAILSYFGACPWDYTDFDYDIMGLVTMEYAPAWFLAGMYFEMLYAFMKNFEQAPYWRKYTLTHSSLSDNVVVRLLHRLQWMGTDEIPSPTKQDDIQQKQHDD